MSTLSLLNPIFKDDYGEYVRQFNDQCWILDNAIAGSSESFDGRRVLHNIHTKRSSGVGSRGDDGTLPTAGNQTTKNIYIPLRYHYGRMVITGPTMAQGAAGRGAFVSSIQLEMDGLRKDWGRDMCRQVWGTSNGVIARCESNSTTTVTLYSTTTVYQVEQIWSDGGMVCDIGTVADPDYAADGIAVTDYSVATAGAYTITLASAPAQTVTNSHYVFRHDNGGASDASGSFGDGQSELTGLQTAVSTSLTLHGLAVADGGKQWQSTVKSNSGTNRPITEALIIGAGMEAANKSGRSAKAAACNRGVYVSLINMLTASKRHIVDATADNSGLKLQSGASGIMLHFPGWGAEAGGKLPVIADRDCPGNSLYGLDIDSLRKYQLGDIHWIDDDGSVLHRVADKDKFEASLRCYMEVGYVQRNGFWSIVDITEDA